VTGTAESNSRAHCNGKKGEDEAIKLLLERSKQFGVKRVNGLLDFLIDHTWIEVKTCQHRTVDNSIKGGFRNGRFVFNRDQHKALQKYDGLYMFIVLKNGELFKHRLMRARDIKYHDKKTWCEIFIEQKGGEK